MIGLLRMVSGEESIGIPDMIDWDMRTTVHTVDDPQCGCLSVSTLPLQPILSLFFSLVQRSCNAQTRSMSTMLSDQSSKSGYTLRTSQPERARCTTPAAPIAARTENCGGFTR